MATAELFHAQNTRDSAFYREDGKIYSAADALKAFRAGLYTPVATFKIDDADIASDYEDALGQVWNGSQNFSGAWRPANPTRSSMVGDIVRMNDHLYVVAACGFDLLTGD